MQLRTSLNFKLEPAIWNLEYPIRGLISRSMFWAPYQWFEPPIHNFPHSFQDQKTEPDHPIWGLQSWARAPHCGLTVQKFQALKHKYSHAVARNWHKYTYFTIHFCYWKFVTYLCRWIHNHTHTQFNIFKHLTGKLN